jgi:hypothetical protein
MIPASLRRILDRQKPQPKAEPVETLTLIWRDGETWRKEPGRNWRQRPSITPLHDSP